MTAFVYTYEDKEGPDEITGVKGEVRDFLPINNPDWVVIEGEDRTAVYPASGLCKIIFTKD